jgi:regulator of protease activity HflC (stomatin/prohibitin superfamily)
MLDVIFLFFFILLIFFLKGIVIVKENEVIVIERLGKYRKILPAGLHIIMPMIDAPRIVQTYEYRRDIEGNLYKKEKMYTTRINIQEKVFEFKILKLFTKDAVSINIPILIYCEITDVKKAVYNVENIQDVIEKLIELSLKNIVKELTFNEVDNSYDIINDKLQEILINETEKWGVKVNKIEIKEIVMSDYD